MLHACLHDACMAGCIIPYHVQVRDPASLSPITWAGRTCTHCALLLAFVCVRSGRFCAQVLGLMELDAIRGAMVGIPGRTGLSVEQRKRLTIGVELVANPSVIFMDEPTSGAAQPARLWVICGMAGAIMGSGVV